MIELIDYYLEDPSKGMRFYRISKSNRNTHFHVVFSKRQINQDQTAGNFAQLLDEIKSQIAKGDLKDFDVCHEEESVYTHSFSFFIPLTHRGNPALLHEIIMKFKNALKKNYSNRINHCHDQQSDTVDMVRLIEHYLGKNSCSQRGIENSKPFYTFSIGQSGNPGSVRNIRVTIKRKKCLNPQYSGPQFIEGFPFLISELASTITTAPSIKAFDVQFKKGERTDGRDQRMMYFLDFKNASYNDIDTFEKTIFGPFRDALKALYRNENQADDTHDVVQSQPQLLGEETLPCNFDELVKFFNDMPPENFPTPDELENFSSGNFSEWDVPEFDGLENIPVDFDRTEPTLFAQDAIDFSTTGTYAADTNVFSQSPSVPTMFNRPAVEPPSETQEKTTSKKRKRDNVRYVPAQSVQPNTTIMDLLHGRQTTSSVKALFDQYQFNPSSLTQPPAKRFRQ